MRRLPATSLIHGSALAFLRWALAARSRMRSWTPGTCFESAAATPPDFHVGYENNSDSFRRNIIAVSSQELNPNWNPEGGGDIYKLIFPPPKKWIGDVDSNVFFNAVVKFSVTVAPRGQMRRWAGGDRYTLKEWRKLGYDLHSVFADPMFIDPAKGDYRVKPESPTLKMGFKNFEMDQFGLLPEFPNQWQDR